MINWKHGSPGQRSEAKKIYKKLVNDFNREYKKEQFRKFERIVLSTCQEVLYLEFGFGYARQQRFINKFNEIIDCINEGYVSLDDIEKSFKYKKAFGDFDKARDLGL